MRMRTLGPLVAVAASVAIVSPARADEPAPSEAASPPETVLVLPLVVQPGVPDWTGVAVAEVVLDAIALDNANNFLTLKQLDSVLRRRDQRLNDVRVPLAGPELAHTLGATRLVTGTIMTHGDGLSIDLQSTSIKDGSVFAQAHAEGPLKTLPKMAHGLAIEISKQTPKSPMTQSPTALEQLARCAIELDHQSLAPRARTFMTGAKLELASVPCDAALKADSKLGLAHAYHAILTSLRGDNPGARKEAAAVTKTRFVPIAALAEWFAARRANDVEGSRKVLEKAVEAHPGFLHAIGYLGEDRQELNEDAAAFEWWRKYLERAPGHPWATARAGRALARLNKMDAAIAFTQKALVGSPNDPELLIELASRYIDAKRLDEAEKILIPLLTVKPPRPLAALRLGYLYQTQGKLKSAREQFLKAVTLAQRDDEARTRAIAYADLAQVAGKEGLLDNALEALRAAAHEGMRKLPCDAPELVQWKGNAEFEQVCASAAAQPAGPEEEDVVSVELQ